MNFCWGNSDATYSTLCWTLIKWHKFLLIPDEKQHECVFPASNSGLSQLLAAQVRLFVGGKKRRSFILFFFKLRLLFLLYFVCFKKGPRAIVKIGARDVTHGNKCKFKTRAASRGLTLTNYFNKWHLFEWKHWLGDRLTLNSCLETLREQKIP